MAETGHRDLSHRPRAGRWAMRAGALLALLAVAASVNAQSAAPMHRCQTAHYNVRTDTSPMFAELVGRHMEEIFSEYSRRFKDYGELEERFDVAVFTTQERYVQEVSPEVRGTAGIFSPGRRLLAAHTENRTPEEVLRTLYHEGFHQFMFFVISKGCPIWVNEGIAEYFSEATWNGQAFTTGQVPTQRLLIVQQALRAGKHVPFRTLFTLSNDRWLQRAQADNSQAALQYSQSWSIVHFLVHAEGGRYADMLNTYLHEVADGEDAEDAFVKSFGADLAAFEQAWARHVMALKPSPKYACRDNMEALMLVAGMVYNDLSEFDSVSELRSKLLFTSGYHWTVTRPNGEVINSRDREQVAALFRCPFDRSDARISYVLVRNVRTDMPMLICDHHSGVVVKAYFDPRRTDRRVMVEEQVRETVTADLKQAIVNAKALQDRR